VLQVVGGDDECRPIDEGVSGEGANCGEQVLRRCRGKTIPIVLDQRSSSPPPIAFGRFRYGGGELLWRYL
jgi:hypothetical protein